MLWLEAATGENRTLSLYEINRTLFFSHLVKAYLLKTIHLQVLIHYQRFEKVFLYFYENKKGLHRRQILIIGSKYFVTF